MIFTAYKSFPDSSSSLLSFDLDELDIATITTITTTIKMPIDKKPIIYLPSFSPYNYNINYLKLKIN
jgi:hypothetical protein